MRVLVNTFITVQFSYTSVVWMVYSRRWNYWKQVKFNHIHEGGTLRLIRKNYTSSFVELLLLKDNSFRIHEHNFQTLEVKIFLVKLVSVNDNMKNGFWITENSYNTRDKTKFNPRNACTVRDMVLKVFFFVTPRISSSIPWYQKECSSANKFKAKIKIWYPENSLKKFCKS